MAGKGVVAINAVTAAQIKANLDNYESTLCLVNKSSFNAAPTPYSIIFNNNAGTASSATPLDAGWATGGVAELSNATSHQAAYNNHSSFILVSRAKKSMVRQAPMHFLLQQTGIKKRMLPLVQTSVTQDLFIQVHLVLLVLGPTAEISFH